MASRDFNPKTGKARLFFRYGGKQFNKTIRVKDDNEARRAWALIEETIQDLERGKLVMPPDADAGDVHPVGREAERVSPSRLRKQPKPATLGERLRDLRRDADARIEGGEHDLDRDVHASHFRRVLGESDGLRYPGGGRAPEVRGHERLAKGWAGRRSTRNCPRCGWSGPGQLKRRHVAARLDLEDGRSDLAQGRSRSRPFRPGTRSPGRIERDDLTEEEQAELWECLWLDQEQTVECLTWVKEQRRYPFIYPMFAFAAYTGARRSEMLRSEREDWDFEAGFVSIRQKKADKSKTFTRRNVPIHPALADVMTAWFDEHPGGPWTIATG